MTSLPLTQPALTDCWNRVGVWGDRSCPELAAAVHCHNCPVFAGAGRRFLDGPTPDGYLDEWARRLAAPIEEPSADLAGALIFRLGEEWLALPVRVLVEVTTPRPIHRVPLHRASRGFLAGLVNIRGELHLCARLDGVLGLRPGHADACALGRDGKSLARLLVAERDGDRWVFPVDEVDQVHRFAPAELTPVPATVGRSLARLSRGVFHWGGRSIGYLDDGRLFETLRARLAPGGAGAAAHAGGGR
jgi:chemotaxis-related protein WspD